MATPPHLSSPEHPLPARRATRVRSGSSRATSGPAPTRAAPRSWSGGWPASTASQRFHNSRAQSGSHLIFTPTTSSRGKRVAKSLLPAIFATAEMRRGAVSRAARARRGRGPATSLPGGCRRGPENSHPLRARSGSPVSQPVSIKRPGQPNHFRRARLSQWNPPCFSTWQNLAAPSIFRVPAGRIALPAPGGARISKRGPGDALVVQSRGRDSPAPRIATPWSQRSQPPIQDESLPPRLHPRHHRLPPPLG